MIATEVNILPWYEALAQQHHLKDYAFGAYYCMPTPAGFLIPFQLRREAGGASVSAFTLIEVATGTETSILAAALAGGLEEVEYSGYGLIIFPGTISIGSFNVGRHYLRLQAGAATWYSEVFNFVDTTAGLVKVEWWHDGDFCYPDGHIRYNYPYKSRLYVCTGIGKPSYQFEEEAKKRNGKNFKLRQASIKVFRFSFEAPEYIFDALRLAGLHDFVEITNYNDGRTHIVDELNMDDPEWLEQGDLANATVEFLTDTVVVKSGKGVSTLVYEPEPGGCIKLDYTAVAHITENSSNWHGKYFISESTGEAVMIEDGDYVLVTETASPYNVNLYQYHELSGMYLLFSVSEGANVYDSNTGNYFFYSSGTFTKPVIDDITAGVLTGRTFGNTMAAIYSRIGAVSTLIDTVTAAEIVAGVAVTIPPGTEFVYFVALTPACPVIMESSPYYIMIEDPIGVGYDTVEDDLIVY